MGKQSKDKEKADSRGVLDTQSIIAGKMGSGVSITPAKPKTGAGSTSGLNISSAGLTLGSGVTIRPNKPSLPANNTGVSITPVEKSNTATSSSASASSTSQSSTAVDPNLTDDTFVVEAPSFIVPYVYEKPPKEAIRDFKESIDDIVEKKKKEKEERKAAGEEVSDDEDEKKKGEEEEEDEKEKDEKSEKDE